MRAKHTAIFEKLCTKFSPDVINNWEVMATAWERDQNQPNPFAEPSVGEHRYHPILSDSTNYCL
jgi:hypothetical protein